jgi:hypothetical protein
MTFNFVVVGLPWTVKASNGIFSWPPLLAAATTYGHTTVYDSGICPDSVSLAHEWYHCVSTHWLRYALSFTIGRAWKDAYWRNEEIGANAYGAAHAADPIFVNCAHQVRVATPANIETVTLSHPV